MYFGAYKWGSSHLVGFPCQCRDLVSLVLGRARNFEASFDIATLSARVPALAVLFDRSGKVDARTTKVYSNGLRRHSNDNLSLFVVP